MTHSERLPPEESDIPDDVPLGDGVSKVWYEEGCEESDTDSESVDRATASGDWYGTDGHGEFRLRTGSKTPVTEEEVGYRPCNCVVKFTFERYGERRYCTGYAAGKTCKHHRHRVSEGLMKQRAKNFKTGANAKSHKAVFTYLPTHKKIVANDLYKSLLGESSYDFETTIEELEIKAGDADFVPDEVDTLVLEHPVPNDKEIRAKALWYAALDFIKMESIAEEQFRTAFEQQNDPDVQTDRIAIGERWQVVGSGESGPVYDKDEHHLNLPLSRIQKDYDRNLTFGGVDVEDATEDASDMSAQEWHVTISDSEEEMQPEAQFTGEDTSPLDDVTPE